MNRKYTNFIRHIMDEWIPPFIRDNRYFMYPAFYYWFKGKNLNTYMHWKSLMENMHEDDFNRAYQELDHRASDRKSDSSEECLDFVISKFNENAKSLLDVGCGRGYFLDRIVSQKNMILRGCDLHPALNLSTRNWDYTQASIYKLPFNDNEFDIVTCQHTIEHLRNVNDAIIELSRVCRNQLILITPRQRYYYYTLDMHLNFYPEPYYLLNEVPFIKNVNHEIKEINGDWALILHLNK